jgi:hypothetical protein
VGNLWVGLGAEVVVLVVLLELGGMVVPTEELARMLAYLVQQTQVAEVVVLHFFQLQQAL